MVRNYPREGKFPSFASKASNLDVGSGGSLVSAAVMLKNGMVEEGRIRDHVFTHGAWRDSITHSILEGEWGGS